MTKVLRLVLGDQLSDTLASLQGADPQHDKIMLCEVMEEASYVPHHPQKIALIFAAMRHFAEHLASLGFDVRYVKLDDNRNTGSFEGELQRAVDELKPEGIVLTEPGEYRVLQKFEALQAKLGIPVEVLADTRFLCSRTEFANWAKGKKQLRMEFFYREMRRKHHILLDDAGEPLGGRWNFDSENREPPAKGLKIPVRRHKQLSLIGGDVLALVRERFAGNFGQLEPFNYALTREEALLELDYFIENLLEHFGTYQDVMLEGEPLIYHSALSAYMNIGLLLPLEVCRRAEEAYKADHVPLNSAEGFIRQILGWREYVRGIYWTHMPDYAELNFFGADRKLPALYWGGATRMNCLKGAVEHTSRYAYSHHIQRLMVTGNFALLAGLDVAEVQAWYLAVYIDAFEWVEMPNTLGMALFGDGGLMASKPYAASGKYINKMSNYCKGCKFNSQNTLEADACPFNALYWDFIDRNKHKLHKNQRMAYTYATLSKMSPEKIAAIKSKAQETLSLLDRNEL